MSERNQKRMQALAAKSVSSWVEPDGVSDGSLIFLIRVFLHKCPCPGVSAAGKSIPALERVDNSAAEKMLKQIEKRVPRMFFDKEPGRVAKWLHSENADRDEVPYGVDEFISATFSPGILIASYQQFPGKKVSELRSSDWKDYAAILKLDGVFRHVRNSLAHSFFCEVSREKDGASVPYFFFQDVSGRQNVSARMFLSKPTLEYLAQIGNSDGGIEVN